jgi:isoleucyl-tRNA synthetase
MVSEQFEGHTWAEAALEYERIRGVKPSFASMHMLSEIGGAESTEALATRTAAALEDIQTRFAGKRVLIVAHGNVFRLVYAHAAGLPITTTQEDRRFRLSNTECVRLPNTPQVSPIDRWMLGELSTLQARVTDSYERYDLQTGARVLIEFLDNLTNWFVRRSRKRFWGTGSWNVGDTAASADKASAYETLYTVLTEVCKIAAPMIPFITESVYQGLTGRESVHLEYASPFNRLAIDIKLLADMAQVQELVTLGLALRARKKLRVRQPLQSVTIEKELDAYFVEILREELNVREVIMGADMSTVARRVCRPNAKLIGPRLGRSVQEVITAAKSGAFGVEADGSVIVTISTGVVPLTLGEFELVYEPIILDADVEGNGGLVLMMDCVVTEELALE